MSEPTQPIDVRCPACNAAPGDACMTKGGRPTDPHGPRVELFKETRDEVRKLIAWEQACHTKGPSQ